MRLTHPQFQNIRSPEDLGRAIRMRRKALKLTQEDVAAQVGLARVTVGAIENGKDTAQLGIALQLCADLGITLAVFQEADNS